MTWVLYPSRRPRVRQIVTGDVVVSDPPFGDRTARLAAAIAGAQFTVPAVPVRRIRITSSHPTQVAFVVEPSNVVEDTVISPSITVAIRDGAGNVVPSATNTVTLSIASGTGTLGGTLSRAAVNGVATFNDITVDTAGSFTLAAAATGLTGDTSASFTVSAAGSAPSLTQFEPIGATRLTAASGLAMNIGNWVATSPETEANPWSWVAGNPPSTYDSPWAATVTDGAAPYRPTQVGRLRGTSTNPTPPYGNGIVGKAASARLCPPGAWSSLYCAFAVKIDSSWRQYADQLKCFEWFMTSGGIIIAIDCANDNVGTPPFRFEYYNWGSSSDHEYGTSSIPLDTWVVCYCLIEDNGANQRQRVWQHPVGGSATLVIDAVMTRTFSGNPFEFGYVNTYGGGGGPGLTAITTNIDIYFDTVYLSYT